LLGSSSVRTAMSDSGNERAKTSGAAMANSTFLEGAEKAAGARQRETEQTEPT